MNDAAKWFKSTFGEEIEAAVEGTPFTLDLLTAIAIQETYEIWGRVFDKMEPADILAACVGDVITAPKRGAFPKTKDELLAAPNGAAIFAVARQALVDMAKVATEYAPYVKNPDRFCHAFGVFQYDIQFCQTDPDFFIKRLWPELNECLDRCIAELTRATKKLFGAGKAELSDLECAFIGIAYNTGSCNPAKGLKQGFKDDTGKFYGEYVAEYLTIAQNAVV